MKHFLLDITLNEDCIFSMQNITTGGHQTLTHIPGSALLGAVATRLYPHLSTNDAFAVFHSGSLRFGNGYPTTHAGKVAWPIPLCWHRAKTQEVSPHHPLNPEHIYNFLHVSELPDFQQPKQMREGYISEDGELILPRSSFRLKTAIDPRTGCAAEGQLFGYSSLMAGQSFKAELEADDDFPPELLGQVKEILEREILLGRSRSAEYGRTSIRVTPADPPFQDQEKSAQTRQLTLWFLSDCFPCHPSGMPSTDITAESLGLPPGAQIDWRTSFTRTRSFSSWNAYRQGYDRERFGIQAGSVLSISFPDSDLSNITASLTRRIGLYREGGAGQVWVNPPLLRHKHPSFISSTDRDTTSLPSPQRPNHPLLNWLTKPEGADLENCQEEAWKIAGDYWKQIDSVRRDKGFPETATDFYPSVSQWGTVLQAARTKSGNDLYQALFSHTNAVIKPTGKNWGLDICVMDKSCKTLDEWIKMQISQGTSCNASLVQHLARKLMDGHPNQKKTRGELK
ncbi:hypothetical protein [Ferrovum myxofaciens]|jgi:hypothetical protein|uniref:CRISPR-associated protein Csx10 n=1 Tax=Ferrovum myxofaciens TaxID=416213 RepID=A0A9E6MWS5_9PROT|nr:hypothetical protein [Ferrovum myxofaciens]MBU6995019.1 hypothetical protein [Ferrovum myxofaciens]QKE38819.1 MAG: hypothetical protein HO273_08780 [Ferrovum myxofaciens]QKE41406.1 MAG: hypothetical protein HO274_08815 [Ferrovum myxofaciens]QWY74029.1 MAG: hypothetical protein JVY19_09300 [Ferrovum myxofaciens]QWY76781.1 MAG: hypothetical protein JZL65_09755 [Ferrovum myxofaciens]